MLNTRSFAGVVLRAREKRFLSQVAVQEAGGPSRQIIIDIEHAQPVEVSDATLRKLDEGLGLPAGFCFSVLAAEHGPEVHYRVGERRFAGDPLGRGPTLGFQGVDGEPVDFPAVLVTTDRSLQALSPALLFSGHHLLLDVNVVGDMKGHASFLVGRWEAEYGLVDDQGAPRSVTTTLRASTRMAAVVDPFDAVDTLGDARDLLDCLGGNAVRREGAAVVALFIAYASRRLKVPGTEILAVLHKRSDIQATAVGESGMMVSGRLSVLLEEKTDRPARLAIIADGVERDERGKIREGAYGPEQLATDLVVLWQRFFAAVGASVEVAIGDALGGLGDVITQRSAVSQIVLSSDPNMSPLVYWADPRPVGDLVGPSPVLVLYDNRAFGQMPALLAWASSRRHQAATFVTVTSSPVKGVLPGDKAVVVQVSSAGVDDWEVVTAVQRDGGAALTHLQPGVDGWMGVLTQASGGRCRSIPVFIPEE